ncbi:hypothetical protein COO92_10260 [Thalassospira lohafexi]|uniref:DUF2946 domain-containing protein n=2 Tax=Thalassospira lohafexi TaxID=744227 RepID=A0A2N3L5M7_9PROT|nr:hypothetical protein COO92_10260 [Thalassospira lohafexi]
MGFPDIWTVGIIAPNGRTDMINVIARDRYIVHIKPMRVFTCSHSASCVRPLSRLLQVWGMACVILLAGVTQSGFITALLGGQGIGVSGAQAAPGGDLLLICTPDGIRAVSLGGGDLPTPDGENNAAHGFCSLCATHHGVFVDLGVPDISPVSKVGHITYAHAIGVAAGHEIPRIRHSRAPPLSV